MCTRCLVIYIYICIHKTFTIVKMTPLLGSNYFNYHQRPPSMNFSSLKSFHNSYESVCMLVFIIKVFKTKIQTNSNSILLPFLPSFSHRLIFTFLPFLPTPWLTLLFIFFFAYANFIWVCWFFQRPTFFFSSIFKFHCWPIIPLFFYLLAGMFHLLYLPTLFFKLFTNSTNTHAVWLNIFSFKKKKEKKNNK